MPWLVARGLLTSRSLRWLLFRPYVAHPSDLDARLTAEALRNNGGKGALYAARLTKEINLEQIFAAVRVPVALIWGSEDRLLRESDLVRTRELMNITAEFELDGVGHWPMIESPARLGEILASIDFE